MFTLRCTQRLLKRTNVATTVDARAPTTRLGDWYANLIHVGRLQLVLCVSEHTLLPVLIPVAPVSDLVPRLRFGLVDVLRELGVSKQEIEKEDAEMSGVVYGKTANRKVTGVMVEFGRMLPFYMEDGRPLLDVSLHLAETPCSPLYKTTISPDRATIALFARPPLQLVR